MTAPRRTDVRTGHESHSCFLATHLHAADPPNTSQSAPLGLATFHALVQSRIDGGLVFSTVSLGSQTLLAEERANRQPHHSLPAFRIDYFFSTLSSQVNLFFCYPSRLNPGALLGF